MLSLFRFDLSSLSLISQREREEGRGEALFFGFGEWYARRVYTRTTLSFVEVLKLLTNASHHPTCVIKCSQFPGSISITPVHILRLEGGLQAHPDTKDTPLCALSAESSIFSRHP